MPSTNKKAFTTGTIILTAIVAFIPLVKTDFNSLIDFELFPKQLVYGILSILLLGLFYKSKIDKPILNLATIGFLVFLLGNIISISTAINSAEAWGTISKNAIYTGLLFALIAGFYTKALDINIISKGAIVFGFIVGLSGLTDISEAFKQSDVMDNIYAIKTLYAHKNFMASAILLAMPLVIYQAIKNEKYFGIAAKIALAIMTLDIALLRTRSVWLAVIVSVIFVLLVFYIFSKEKSSQVKWIKFLGFGTASFVVITFVLLQFTNISESVFDSGSLNKRIIYWESSLEMFAEQPITGIGAGNWRINFPKHGLNGIDATVLEGRTTINRPHNDLLWILSETGMIGFTGFMMFLVFTFWYGIKAFAGAEVEEEKRIILLSLMGMLSFIIYGFFEFPLERPEHFFFFILYAALIISAYMQTHNPKGVKIKVSSLFFLLMIYGTFSTYVVSQRLKGALNAKKTLSYYGTNNFKGLVLNGEKAVNTYYNMDDFGNPIHYFIAMGKYGDQNIKAARNHFKISLEDHPYHILSYIQLGNTYKNEKKYEKALEQYLHLMGFVGKNKTALLNIAEVKFYQKKYEEAIFYLKKMPLNSKDKKFMGLTAECLSELYKNPSATKYTHLLPKDGQPHDKAYLFNNYLQEQAKVVKARLKRRKQENK